MAVYFISDIHLGAHGGDSDNTTRSLSNTPLNTHMGSGINADNPREVHFAGKIDDRPSTINTGEIEKQERLEKLFAMVERDGEYLYLVGDIFDFWFEYRTVVHSQYFEFLCRLRSVIRKGVKVRFFPGNHDFWGGDFLRDLGLEIHKKPAIFEHFGRCFHVGHGDGYARRDWGYNWILRPLLRNPVSIFLFRLVHPDLAMALGRLVSGGSRHYTGTRQFPFREEYIKMATHLIEDEGCDYVLHGHTHTALRAPIGKGEYIDIGNFFADFDYVRIDKSGVETGRIE